MLDVRLAIWLSTDPVRKAHQIPYCEVSNCPIIKVDPNGDDDYFDENGEWIFSTQYGNTIRIMTSEDLKIFYGDEVNKKMVDLNYLRYTKEGNAAYEKALTEYLNSRISTPLNKYKVNTNDNWSGAGRANKMIKGIQNHYNQLLKQDDFKSGGIAREYPSNRSMMSTGREGVRIGFDEFRGLMNYPGLADKYNLMNTLVHEYYHWKFHVFQGIETDLNTEQSAIEHLEAYKAQIEHSSWTNTTDSFKDTITKNIGTYLSQIKSNDTIKKEFEKLLGVNYTGLGQNPENVTYEKK